MFGFDILMMRITLYRLKRTYKGNLMDEAAQRGDLKTLKFLQRAEAKHYYHEGCTPDAMDKAATNGHLDVVKFLHENRKEGCFNTTLLHTIQNGHNALAAWLYENCADCRTPRAINWIIGYGYRSVLKPPSNNCTVIPLGKWTNTNS
jgi:hypothetical protein